ncbi:hypothetical protein AB0E10_45040, partial [Streptomyces sp. NPDC048045]
EPGSRDPLVFRQLPSTQAVTSLESATILHVFLLTSEWRHHVLTAPERTALNPAEPLPGAAASGSPGPYGVDTDALEQSLIDALTPDEPPPGTRVEDLLIAFQGALGGAARTTSPSPTRRCLATPIRPTTHWNSR